MNNFTIFIHAFIAASNFDFFPRIKYLSKKLKFSKLKKKYTVLHVIFPAPPHSPNVNFDDKIYLSCAYIAHIPSAKRCVYVLSLNLDKL